MRLLRGNAAMNSIVFRQIFDTPSRCVVSPRPYRAMGSKRKAREADLAGSIHCETGDYLPLGA
jgi:hypothetical protein